MLTRNFVNDPKFVAKTNKLLKTNEVFIKIDKHHKVTITTATINTGETPKDNAASINPSKSSITNVPFRTETKLSPKAAVTTSKKQAYQKLRPEKYSGNRKWHTQLNPRTSISNSDDKILFFGTNRVGSVTYSVEFKCPLPTDIDLPVQSKQNKKKAVTFFGAVKVESIDYWNEGVLRENGKNHNISVRQK
ncbi:13201_t:CDS:2, partial [Dentiscutata erythropus]